MIGTMSSAPSYIDLLGSGRLQSTAEALSNRLKRCNLCPNECGTDRIVEPGAMCGIGALPRIASYAPHHGEERPISGSRGSGTIFFSGCNMHCQFCQNWDISQNPQSGREVSPGELGTIMLELQRNGCHNINFVSPTHVVPAVVKALAYAAERGLNIPIVYNSGGYDSVSTLGELEGIVDIYMPDFKYADEYTARKLSGVDNYPHVARAAVKEMHRQSSDLSIDAHGIAGRGLLVRHLVLPGDLAGSREIIDFLITLSRNTYLNIMGQYRPAYRAGSVHGLGRRPTFDEISAVAEYARTRGMRRLDGEQGIGRSL